MFENIRADFMRTYRIKETSRLIDYLYSVWVNYGLRAIVIYRFGRWLNHVPKHSLVWFITILLYPLYSLLSAWTRKAYGIDLDLSADIGPGFYINHFGGIEVRNCRIGSHCNIQQQVKVGSAKTTNNSLVIGENVYIGAHTHIFSDVTVGDGVTVGAGALVTEDIPAHCLVLGNPGRIAQRNYDNSVLL
jgi:serine O-acetyltransferase